MKKSLIKLKDMTVEQLIEAKSKSISELLDQQRAIKSGSATNLKIARNNRKNIARMNTIINQKQSENSEDK